MATKRRNAPTTGVAGKTSAKPKGGSPLSFMASPVATVAVYQKENGGFFVEPPAILVSTGHDLRLVNATNFAVTVTIRNRPQTPIGAHSDGPVTIPTNVRLFYPHPYRIDVGGMQAFGNSDPVIIIDR